MNVRPIEERDLTIGEGVRAAVELIKKIYGAVLTHDSGHTKTGPTWIFTFPRHSNAQIALRMNKAKVSLYFRSKTLGGKSLLELADGLFVLEKKYPDPDGKPAESLHNPRHAYFLNPSKDTPLLLVQPNPDCLQRILDLYLAIPLASVAIIEPITPIDGDVTVGSESGLRKRPVLSEAKLLEQLDRNALTGKAGELIAVLDELKRLTLRGCTEREKFVERIALNDVGRGYDIASIWPGEERCIEVKSTTVAGSDFFITENECKVLVNLGDTAWLYRVVLGADGSGEVTSRLQDPMKCIGTEHLTPVVWRVASEALGATVAAQDSDPPYR